jgi:serine protease Do
VRVLRISGADLNIFEFDYDLTWTVFLMNASNKIYGRYGGRDAKSADSRNSLEGLHFAMAAALAEHRRDPSAKPAQAAKKPVYVDDFPTAKKYYSNGCIHCHQVAEILREEQKNAGTWVRERMFTYPLPENVGITLDVNRGNLVREVKPGSAAATAGLMPGDVVRAVNQNPVHSFADASYGLHKGPLKGSIPIAWQRDGKPMDGTLTLSEGWRRTNVTWRPSLFDLLPSLTVYGSDLSAKEKQQLGLGEKRLAFRQEAPVHAKARAMGVRENDIILGVDDKKLDMTMEQFLGYVRQNYLIGETLTLNLLRDGKRVDLSVTLK